MEKFKLIILINCHENKESIKDGIDNIFKFNPETCVILNDGTKENLDELKRENVFVVKRKVGYDRFDTMVPLHIELKDCMVENELTSEYVLMQATNQLFVKKGFYDYIKKYKGSYYGRKIDERCIVNLKHNHIFKKYYDELTRENFKYQSNHDGMFFTYHDFMSMMDYFENFRGQKLHFHAEEFLYVAYLLKNIGMENLVEFDKYNYWQPDWGRNLSSMSVDEVEKAKNDGKFLVKRISRDMNDPARKHIREMQ